MKQRLAIILSIFTIIFLNRADTPWAQAYFSPDDNVVQKFVSYIDDEQESIDIAIYTLTHQKIVKALINAHKRGIRVSIVIDEFSLTVNNGNPSIRSLLHADVPLYLFNPKIFYHGSTGNPQLFYNQQPFLSGYNGVSSWNQKEKLTPEQIRQLSIRPVLHHKFCIFGKNRDDAPLVWTGSFNFTFCATARNQENVLVIRDSIIINAFKNQFNIIKTKRASRLQPHAICKVQHDDYSCQLFFAPDEQALNYLIDIIDNEQESIKMAIYSISHHAVIEALIRAHNRGVKIEIVIDHGKKSIIANAGISVYQFASENYSTRAYENESTQQKENPSRRSLHAIMHNKFCIFSKNKKGRSLLWTGSINFTYFSTHLFQNNALVIDDPKIIGQFEGQFELIKNYRSKPYKKSCLKKIRKKFKNYFYKKSS